MKEIGSTEHESIISFHGLGLLEAAPRKHTASQTVYKATYFILSSSYSL